MTNYLLTKNCLANRNRRLNSESRQSSSFTTATSGFSSTDGEYSVKSASYHYFQNTLQPSAHPDFQPTYLIRIIISFFSVIYKIWALSRHQSRNIFSIKLEYCIPKKLHVQWDTLNDVKCHLREEPLSAYRL